jgi:hypothetical protein
MVNRASVRTSDLENPFIPTASQFVGKFSRKIERIGSRVADKTVIGHGVPLAAGNG